MMEDTQIIDMLFERSEQAIAELAAKYGKLCNRIALNIVADKQDAEECVNDTYLAVWNAVPPAKPNPLLAFVCKITRNIALSKSSYNNRQKRTADLSACLNELEECIPSPNSVEDEVCTAELEKTLNQFLAALTSIDQIIFVRRYWFVDDFSSISQYLGMSEGNVRVRLHRIRNKLKGYFEKEFNQ